jgi:hypothetical protein
VSLRNTFLATLSLFAIAVAHPAFAQMRENVQQRKIGDNQVQVKIYQGVGTINVSNDKLGVGIFGKANSNRCGPEAGAQLSIRENTPEARNAAAKEPLRVFVDEILAICPNTQSLRLEVRPGMGNPLTMTISSANGWIYREATTSIPDRIAFQDQVGLFLVNYNGPCEAEPTLLIEPVSEDARRQAYNIDSVTGEAITTATRQFALKFRSVCPLARNSVRFAIDPMPRRYGCTSPDGCFLKTSMADNSYQVRTDAGEGWRYDYAIDAEKRAQNFESIDDASGALAAGDVELLHASPAFFDFYLRTFLEAYSKACRTSIKDGVTKTYVYVEYKRYGDGRTEKVNESEPYSITVERPYLSAYEGSRAGEISWSLGQLLPDPVKGMAALRSQMDLLNKTVSGHCTDDYVLTIYHNLMARATGSTAIRGKYPSRLDAAKSVKASRESSPHDVSAPAFVEKYRQARAEAATR